MVAWEKPLAELCPGLETEAVLTACCRSRTGLLADDGERWAVLIFPGGKGSSVVQQDGLYHLDRFHNMPAALIIQDPDPVLVAGAIIMELPMVDKVDPAFYETVKDGDMVEVNADEGYVEILD